MPNVAGGVLNNFKDTKEHIRCSSVQELATACLAGGAGRIVVAYSRYTSFDERHLLRGVFMGQPGLTAASVWQQVSAALPELDQVLPAFMGYFSLMDAVLHVLWAQHKDSSDPGMVEVRNMADKLGITSLPCALEAVYTVRCIHTIDADAACRRSLPVLVDADGYCMCPQVAYFPVLVWALRCCADPAGQQGPGAHGLG